MNFWPRVVWIRSSSFHKQNTEYQLEEVKLNRQIPPQHGQSQATVPPSSGMSFLEPVFHEEIFPGQFLNESNQTDTNVKRKTKNRLMTSKSKQK
jgi:hypothetical protein